MHFATNYDSWFIFLWVICKMSSWFIGSPCKVFSVGFALVTFLSLSLSLRHASFEKAIEIKTTTRNFFFCVRRSEHKNNVELFFFLRKKFYFVLLPDGKSIEAKIIPRHGTYHHFSLFCSCLAEGEKNHFLLNFHFGIGKALKMVMTSAVLNLNLGSVSLLGECKTRQTENSLPTPIP